MVEQTAPGSNFVTAVTFGGSQIQLDLFPTVGPSVSAVSPSAFFFFNYVSTTCTGLGALACTVNNALLTNGATINGTANLTMTIVSSAAPEPTLFALLGAGLAGLAVRRRRA